jgi:hypothetical protein
MRLDLPEIPDLEQKGKQYFMQQAKNSHKIHF